jgi:hypothetical protein
MELGKSPASQSRKGERPVRPAPGFGLLFWVGTAGFLSCLALEWERSVLLIAREPVEQGESVLEERQHWISRLPGGRGSQQQGFFQPHLMLG